MKQTKINRKKTNEEQKMILPVIILTLVFTAPPSLPSEVRSTCPVWFLFFDCNGGDDICSMEVSSLSFQV